MASPLVIGIYLALQALPPAYGEQEDPNARDARLADLAVAIDEAADSDDQTEAEELAAALVVEAWEETRLSVRVHRMGPRKDTRGYAISLWSLHSWTLVPRSEWLTLGGLEGTTRAAHAAARVLRWTRARCGSWSGAFALYATGRTCRWKGAAQREWQFRRVLRWMRSVNVVAE